MRETRLVPGRGNRAIQVWNFDEANDLPWREGVSASDALVQAINGLRDVGDPRTHALQGLLLLGGEGSRLHGCWEDARREELERWVSSMKLESGRGERVGSSLVSESVLPGKKSGRLNGGEDARQVR